MSVLCFTHPRKLTPREITQAVRTIMSALRRMTETKLEK